MSSPRASSGSNPSFLIENSDTHVLVNLDSGKLDPDGKRADLKAQKNITCYLYATRRLGFFSSASDPATTLIAHDYMKSIRKRLVKFDNNNAIDEYRELCKLGIQACNALNIKFNDAIAKDSTVSSTYIRVKLSNPLLSGSVAEILAVFEPKVLWSFLFEFLCKNVFHPILNLQDSNWSPRDGFEGLMNALRTHGAHVFIGKLGPAYHRTWGEVEAENTETRIVYGFPKNSYKGDSIGWTHAVVVDQAKIMNGIPMVFFRDPYDRSEIMKKETVYVLSYRSFTERLYDSRGNSYTQCPQTHYGTVSKNPDRLTSPKI